ncbi:hypothetical protein VNO78_10962 [Psophocarpus tetragonolobus]|uniref:Uncharacterized protein n=1 Tax=Psophocarpus tetragonolobus TaxID=3891 RepID=A0AAN9XNG7_PSOTE
MLFNEGGKDQDCIHPHPYADIGTVAQIEESSGMGLAADHSTIGPLIRKTRGSFSKMQASSPLHQINQLMPSSSALSETDCYSNGISDNLIRNGVINQSNQHVSSVSMRVLTP